MKNTAIKELQDKLISLSDNEYKLFQQKLVPNIDKNSVLGVRVPILRAFAKDYVKTPDSEIFLSTLPHKYYDENCLHSIILNFEKDFSKTIKAVNAFLPYIDNWAVCDILRPKAFDKYLAKEQKNSPDLLLEQIRVWIADGKTYTVRFGIEMLMTFYLDGRFKPEYPALASNIKSDEYYINMMISWFFATALAKQYADTIKYIEENRLSVWVHNKTISKAVESFRITNEQKAYLRTLKRPSNDL